MAKREMDSVCIAHTLKHTDTGVKHFMKLQFKANTDCLQVCKTM